MKLVVNGAEQDVAAETLAAALDALDYGQTLVATALNGEFVPGHFEDFQLPSFSELAEQIEKYVQLAIGANLRERTDMS